MNLRFLNFLKARISFVQYIKSLKMEDLEKFGESENEEEYPELKPSINQMLEIGREMKLSSLEEAFSTYIRHYDCFFKISKYEEQYTKFAKDIEKLGWFKETEDGRELIDISIESALEQYEKRT